MTEIHGTCHRDFEAVGAGFAQNFEEGDLGASCTVVHRGEVVVDIWGGHRDVAATQPWERDTIVNVWSTTKMMGALCLLMLHDRGLLSVDDPVAEHWPEFAANGKEGVLIRHVMSHTAGLPGFDEPISADQIFDWELCCSRLAAQPPRWEPGTASGYHASTQSWLVGELVRRVSGRSIGTFFREEVAEPLGADFHIGVPDSALARVAEMETGEADAREIRGEHPRPEATSGEPDHATLVNSDRWRRAELVASNGHGNARSVARALTAFTSGGELDGVKLVSPDTIERIFDVQAEGEDLVLGFDIRFGIGYGLNSAGMPLGVNERTFFWAGWGGSMAVVDLENDLVVAYVMNRMMPDVVGGMRAARVIFGAHGAVKALAAEG